MALLHLKLHLVAFGHFLLHVGHVGKNALTRIRVPDESESLVRIEHGHHSPAGFILGLDVFVLGDTDLDILEINLLSLSWIGRRIYDSTELIHIGKHLGAVQRSFIALRLLLLEFLFLLLLGALRFTFTLPECFLRSSQIVDFPAKVDRRLSTNETSTNCFQPFNPC